MILIYLILFVVAALYLWLKFVYSYWERNGFPYIKPSIPFGNISNTWFGRQSIGSNLYDLHLHSKKPVEGVYLLFRPALIFRDASLVKKILTTDFASFYDRGLHYSSSDPVGGNMFTQYGQDWKNIRAKLSPTFTSGKLKGMMPTINQIADNLHRKLSTVAEKNEVIDIKDLTIRFGMDVIGTVGFGLDVNSIDNPNHSFREIEKQINSGAFVNRLRLIGGFFCPLLLDALNMSSQPATFRKYMIDIVHNTMEHRRNTQTVRKDFIQLLLQLQNTGKIADGDSFGEEHSTNTKSAIKHLSIEECASQVALFYLAAENPMYNPDAFLPFGDGPKICIGLRMGKITTKIALIKLLQSYDFTCVHDRELVFANHSLTIAIEGGIQVKVSKRQL